MDPLRAERVTRVVVRDARRLAEGARLAADALVEQERDHVTNRERCALDEVAVRLHVRAASGRVHHDVIGVGERRRVLPRERPRRVEVAVVRGQCSAARLPSRHHHTPAVPREHPDRGAVHPSEPPILHAAREQRDRPTRLARRLP